MSRRRAAAFVISHPYVDALACFREPILRLAEEGWDVDLYTSLSSLHPPPAFGVENVTLVPLTMSRAGAAGLIARLAARRPRYDWLFTVPQWSLHYASVAASLAGIPMVCLSDELSSDGEALSAEQQRWRAREAHAHRKCAFTIALSEERGEFIRRENRLGAAHSIFVVPNAGSGPARRLPSRYYQDTLGIDPGKRVVVHAGSWWWKRQFPALETAPQTWNGKTVLVFQGRLANHLGAHATHPNVRVSDTVLPAALMDYAVSSATVGLALYDSATENNRLMGTASGKVLLYLKNMLPVIVTKHRSFDWIEREGCGVLIESPDEIEGAVNRISAEYDRYTGNVRRFYDERLDFNRTFTPVLARLEGR
jgi:hypothetical protein